MILQTKNLFKKFSSLEVLKNINLDISHPLSIAIQGASGEGKTTLLHILAGLDSPTTGDVFFKNKKITASIRKNFFGFIFQSYNLLEDLSVFDNIALPKKILRKTSFENISPLLEKVGLLHKKNIPSKVLSGGEKQRVAIVRAFCNHPEVIFADEPSGNLDRENSKIIHKMLLDFSKKQHKLLIIATHDEELADLCDKKYILQNGELKIL